MNKQRIFKIKKIYIIMSKMFMEMLDHVPNDMGMCEDCEILSYIAKYIYVSLYINLETII